MRKPLVRAKPGPKLELVRGIPVNDGSLQLLAAEPSQTRLIVGDGHDVIGEIIHALRAVADGVHEDGGVLVDDGFLAILLLHVHAEGQHADDRDQGKANDRQADGDLDHREGPAGGARSANAECVARDVRVIREPACGCCILHSAFCILHSLSHWTFLRST